MRIGTRMRWSAVVGVCSLILGACAEQPSGGTTATALQLPAQPVALRLQLASDPAAAPAWRPAGGGTPSFAVTSAVINVRRVDFHAPPGLVCQREKDHDDAEEDLGQADGMVTEDTRTVERGDRVPGATDEEAGDAVPAMAPSGSSGETRFAKCVVERARGDGDDDHGAKIRFDGPFVVDLLTGESTPPLDNLAVPVGTYKRIDLEIDAREDEEQALPAGVSFVGLGSFTTSVGVTVAVELYLEIDEDLRLESARGITIDPEGGEEIVVRIAATDWFAGVAEALEACVGAEPATTTVVIDDRAELLECDAVAKQLKKNFKRLADEDRIAELEEHDPDELRERERERERLADEEEQAHEQTP